MKIGIDIRLWNQTGIGRYIRNLTVELQKIDSNNSYVLFARKQDEAEIKEKITNDKWKIVISNSAWHSIGEQTKFPKIIEKEKVDLMHFTYQQSVPFFYSKPFIVTIHDLIKHHFVTGNASTNAIWLYGFKMLAYRILINNAARKAKKIITVSNSTKREIVDHLRVNPEKVEITYEAADDLIVSSNEENDLGNYFLFVGNVYPHKNADKLVKAFNSLSQKNDSIKLVFVGSEDVFYKRLRKGVRRMEEKGKVVFIFNPDDKKLSSLYKNAVALIRPSLMEGFSLPPLEAMANECLVLASNISVHREILNGAAIYFDPNQVYDIVAKMNYAIDLPKEKRSEFIKKGKEKEREFSWNKTARETLKIYESSLGL